MNNFDRKTQVAVGLMILFLIFVAIRLPQIIVPFAAVLAITIVILAVRKRFNKKFATKCPKCEGPLIYAGYEKVFSGAKSEGDGPDFDSFGYKISKCEDCENEYWEFFIPPSDGGSRVDHDMLTRPEREFWGKEGKDATGRDFSEYEDKSISLGEYKDKLSSLMRKIKQHNKEAGFLDEDLKGNAQIEKEVNKYNSKNPLLKGNTMLLIILVFFLGGLIIYISKPILIPALFTPEVYEGEVVDVRTEGNNVYLTIETGWEETYEFIYDLDRGSASNLYEERFNVKVWLKGLHKEVEHLDRVEIPR